MGWVRVTLEEFARYEEEITAELTEAGLPAESEVHGLDGHDLSPACTCRGCVLERRLRARFGLGEQEYFALRDRSFRRWARVWAPQAQWPAELDEEDARLDALEGG